jgi:protoporphyrinogen oxidase
MNRVRVCTIGAGLAGLTAAYDVARRDAEVIVLDSASELGGLASSLSLEGRKVERFYHFICRGDDDLIALADELGLAKELHWVTSKTSFFYDGKLYPFASPLDLLRFRPVPPTQRLLFGLHVVRSRLRRDWHQLDGISAKRWLIDRVGKKAYDVIWDPLLRVKFGDYHEQVSAAWIWHRMMRVAASRRGWGGPEQLGYFEAGTEVVIQALRRELAANPRVTFRLGTRVDRIVTEQGRVTGVRLTSGEVIDCQAVVSTVALSALVKLVDDFDEEYRHRLSRVDYIGVVCGLLRLREPITTSFWLNINDARIPFNGIIEYTNLNQHLRSALGGQSLVYVPYYVRTTSSRYGLSDAALRREFDEGLALLNPRFRPDWVEDCWISREPHAQAICTVGFASMVPDHRSPVTGLYLTDSTQYYPEDRTISAAIRLGRRVARLMSDDTARFAHAPVAPARRTSCSNPTNHP